MNVTGTSSACEGHRFELREWRPVLVWLVALCAAWAIDAFASQARAAEPVTTYRGLCNASAGIDLGKGYFVVGDDDIDSLVVYKYGRSDAVHEVKVGDYLNGAASADDEADLEGAARIGDRIYWIASHSGKKNESRPTRQHLFATRIVTKGAVPTVVPLDTKPYDKLLSALASDNRFEELNQAMSNGAEEDHGFNIEGLAATRNGGLLIGFRNPLVAKADSQNAGKALVLELKNPADVVDHGANPAFGDLIRLDLGKRGVRSIELIDGEYFIVAGPFDGGTVGDPASRFAIFKWSGASDAKPRHWRDIEPSTFHAEGLFEIAGMRKIYLLSDDGDEQRICKKGRDKKKMTSDKTFRGMEIVR
ncbi:MULTISPECIES: DUF3616 domain-containing protein [unclassified Caballeronia]|uniref:DUF3616 domain-containing protein n=1 Tax=unclassified Caballeronia TaxID=2646786 RepID=UPI0020285DA3|nr:MULTISPECIES: DUF3616 domain-containing protein [unclassified Caballeronia]MDR5766158.1 DUF3616 domain-containing protein [Caballeronia sp. LZ028]